eukprot:gene11908-2474_t
MKPDDAILAVVTYKEALVTLLRKRNLQLDWVKAVTKIFSNILQSSMTRNVFDIVSLLPGSLFVKETLLRAIQELPVVAITGLNNDHEEFLQNVIDIFQRVCQSFPSSVQDLPVDNLLSVASRSELNQRGAAFNSQGPPPEDFRELSAGPTLEDIRPEKKPYLRPIKSRGKYSDGEEYLDVQFRLLREDFIAPLREGIGEIRSSLARADRSQNMKVYRNVKILFPNFTGGGITYKISFDVTKLRHVVWQHSRRLIFGSLVCFSADNFKTCFFGTVAEREVKDLSRGEINVKFMNGLDDVIDAKIDEEFAMAESPSYFEAYYHVLRALQDLKGDKIPFTDYIVSTVQISKNPKYIRYDLAVKEYNFTGCLTERNIKCRTTLLNTESHLEESLLNPSQLKAFQKALSREFTIIQGPPGTGKTFVGLKIVQALLMNQPIWEGNGRANILIVCYTNHALDQYIEGIIKMGYHDIIRVGGRSQSESVQQFSLRNKKKCIDNSSIKTISSAIGRAISRKYELMDGMEAILRGLENLAHSQIHGRIADLNAILEFLPPILQHWFLDMEKSYRQLDVPFLEMFLGLFPFHEGRARSTYRNVRRTEALQRRFANAMHGGMGEEGNYDQENDDAIDIAGDTEALVDRWAMEMDQFTPFVNDRKTWTEEEPDEDYQEEFIDEDGFKLVVPSKRERRALAKRQMNNAEPMTADQVNSIENPMDLNVNERWRLYKYLLEKYNRKCKDILLPVSREYDDCCENVKELEGRKDEHCMKASRVIAMTTTCAARYRQVLGRIQPKIIIIEEAAEVLEAHVLTSLHEHTEHLILIGDHKQLKPKPSVYKLAKEYQLEVSLFERMVKNGMDCHCLDVQHRMRPDIAHLLQDIYPGLRNHPSVKEYPDVKGVSSNLYFIDHRHKESENIELKSKSNQHEAEYIVALCWYLLLQGYSPKQITILTLYTGQLMLLRKLMPRKKFEGVTVTAVDNFQGEENDIILLSLVRSNNEEKIGFAGIENRICVSLSRAKQGMFVIGNLKLLGSQSVTWERILARASAGKFVGEFLRIFCRNHPDRFIDAAKAEDFNAAPEGGCKEQCTFRLNCGHVCQKACHPVDMEHLQITCQKKCKKILCETQHRCEKTCHDGYECGPCKVKVSKIVPQCGHEQKVPCSQDPVSFNCLYPVIKELRCGHSLSVHCHIKDPNLKAICLEKCTELLECGHPCNGTCNECHQGRLHKKCTKKCNRMLICAHLCSEPCSKECPPCNQPCAMGCIHSKCSNVCGEPCPRCQEECQWRCEHKICTKLCSEMCDRDPCNEPCKLPLACNHPCIGLCGEKCPSLCRFCNREEVEDIFFGNEDEEDARFLELVDCHHIFEVEGLDTFMALQQDEETSIQIKSCPKCKTPIKRSMRYGNILKRLTEDLDAVKKQMIAQRRKAAKGILQDLEAVLRPLQINPNISNEISTLIEDKLNRVEQASEKQNERAAELETISETQVECLKRINKLRLLRVGCETINKDVLQLLQHLLVNNASVQQLLDAILELKRLFLYQSVIETRKQIGARLQMEELEHCLSRLQSGNKINKDEMNEMRSNIDAVRKKFSLGIISREEKTMIIKAMGFSKGHWFKCPKGHVYAIGDCGGAMEESKCPECKSVIGGQRHSLASGNTHAGDFDESNYPAWSEAANLGNFHPDDLQF